MKMAGVWVAVMVRGAPHILFPKYVFCNSKIGATLYEIIMGYMGAYPCTKKRLDEHATVDSKGMFCFASKIQSFHCNVKLSEGTRNVRYVACCKGCSMLTWIEDVYNLPHTKKRPCCIYACRGMHELWPHKTLQAKRCILIRPCYWWYIDPTGKSPPGCVQWLQLLVPEGQWCCSVLVGCFITLGLFHTAMENGLFIYVVIKTKLKHAFTLW